MAEQVGSYSIVEYFGENDGYRCGYCKSSDSNFSHGMWAHTLTVQDYQDLVDRGWRRSGQYLYKPTMHVICCPMYTIRCNALDFKLSKSLKKVIKRVQKFLAAGESRTDKSENSSQLSEPESEHDQGFGNVQDIPSSVKEKAEKITTDAFNVKLKSVDPSVQGTGIEGEIGAKEIMPNPVSIIKKDDDLHRTTVVKPSEPIPGGGDDVICEEQPTSLKKSKPGVGADSSRPACKKAKLVRLEKKKQKLQHKGMTDEDITKTLSERSGPIEKTLEDFLNDPLPSNPAHRLEIRLINANTTNREFAATFDAAYEVYKKYQEVIHKDPPTKCTKRQFSRFLVNSPLKFERSGPPSGYGSFHQQYWLDNKLIAVGVIDILPKCVSSVYFYYDPDYSDLSLGVYASLREVSFTRTLHYHAPGLKYYYMGFYIDSCPKMKYKGRLKPSFLLCPETYSWHPFEEACLKIQSSKYSRLNDDKNASDPNGSINVNSVLILYNNICMDYRTYSMRRSLCAPDDNDQIKEYATLVGMACARRLLLYRSGS